MFEVVTVACKLAGQSSDLSVSRFTLHFDGGIKHGIMNTQNCALLSLDKA